MQELDIAKKKFIQELINTLHEHSESKLYQLCGNYTDMLALFGNDLDLSEQQLEQNLRESIHKFLVTLPKPLSHTSQNALFYNIGSEVELPTGNKVNFIDSFSINLAHETEEICINIKHLFCLDGVIKINNMAFVKYSVVEKEAENITDSISLPGFLKNGSVMPSVELEKITPELSQEFKNFFSTGILFEDDLEVNGDFDLNLSDGLLIVVRGDLHVKGNIVNSCGSTGDLLVVLGNVYTDNLIAGGSLINFKKECFVKYFILPYHNDGSLMIDTLKFGILLDDYDHDTYVNTLEKDAIHFTYGNLHAENQYPYDDFKKILMRMEQDEYLDLVPYLLNKENNRNLYTKLKEYREENSIKKEFTNGEIIRYEEMMREMNQRMSVGLVWQTGFSLQDLNLSKDDNVQYYSENVYIDKDFVLDIDRHDGIKMIYIDGNLEIKGSLYHSLNQEALFLVVRGDIKCQNLIQGKGLIFTKGKLIIEKILYLYDTVDGEGLYALSGISTGHAILEDDISFVGEFDDLCSMESIYSQLMESGFFGDEKPAIEKSKNFQALKEILPWKYWSMTAKYKLNRKVLQKNILGCSVTNMQ